ncbi:CDP-diacylglycerol--glycerol-3-phosphate 3-phosphatidyltransferase [Gordonia shandongensis]|uniref:CDP-diacylglycerol--glycerol-3-phosphate 3-phosphatidyltransferase n=1 Tax=Gordonia shandongensis TaxID=376351 RepID=UPI000A023A6A|nr:CDP-diacylglycerol--glycerol-3-phosphate 3-phosphatidyltransferase [Gordonia shandongensis]
MRDDAAAAPVVNIANALTIFRIVLVPVFVVVLFVDGGDAVGWRIAAFAIFAIAAFTDQLDGRLARAMDLVTDFGKMADPIADKALIGAALLGLSVLGHLPWWVTAVILIREIGVTLLRFWVLRYGVIPASRGGKLKTLLQSVAIGLFVLPLGGPWLVFAWVVMAAALVATLVTGVDYVVRALVLRRGSRRRTMGNSASVDDTGV